MMMDGGDDEANRAADGVEERRALWETRVSESFVIKCNRLRENRSPERINLRLESKEECLLAGDALTNNISVKEVFFSTSLYWLDTMSFFEGISNFVKRSPSLQKLGFADIPPQICAGLLRVAKENPRIRSLQCELESFTVHALIEFLGSSQALKELHLSLEHIAQPSTPDQSALVSSIAAANSSLRELSLTVYGNEADLLAALILDALPVDHPIETLGIKNAGRGSCMALRRLVERTRRLKTLWFRDRYNKNSGEVLRGLCSNDTVTSLRLEHVWIDDEEGYLELRDLVRTTIAIKQLALCWTGTRMCKVAFWDGVCNAIAENGTMTSLALHNSCPPPTSIHTMIQRCTGLEKLDLICRDGATLRAVTEAVAPHPALRKLCLCFMMTEHLDLRPVTVALSTNVSLKSLTLEVHELRRKGDGGANILAEHLSSDSCSLVHLKICGCILRSGALAILAAALRSNHTLESLVIVRHAKKTSVKRSWASVLVSSLEVNQTLKHIEITGVEREQDVADSLAFFCKRNKYQPLMPVSPSSVVPLVVKSLLCGTPSGRSVFFFFLKRQQLDMGRLNRKRAYPMIAESEKMD